MTKPREIKNKTLTKKKMTAMNRALILNQRTQIVKRIQLLRVKFKLQINKVSQLIVKPAIVGIANLLKNKLLNQILATALLHKKRAAPGLVIKHNQMMIVTRKTVILRKTKKHSK